MGRQNSQNGASSKENTLPQTTHPHIRNLSRKKTSNESTKRIKKKKSNKIIVANKKGVKTQNAEHHT